MDAIDITGRNNGDFDFSYLVCREKDYGVADDSDGGSIYINDKSDVCD